MRDIIAKYKEIMDNLPVRDSFEEETIQLLKDTARVQKRSKIIQFKKWGRVAATFVILLLLGTGTVAAAEELNLPELVRRLFQDDTSAVKIAQEQYQKLEVCVTDGTRTVQALGIVGDEDINLLLLEFDLAEDEMEESVVGLHIGTYGEEKEDESYFEDWYNVVKYKDEQGDVSYFIQYEIPLGWSNYSKKDGNEIHVVIDGITLDVGMFEEQHYFADMVIPITLNNEFAEEAEEIGLNKSVQFCGREVTVEMVRLSQYRTAFLIHYPADDFVDAMSIFNMMTKEQVYQNGQQVENTNRLTLYHNGQEIAHSDKFLNFYPGSKDGGDGLGEYRCSLFMDEVDLQEGDTLEIHLGDATIPIL